MCEARAVCTNHCSYQVCIRGQQDGENEPTGSRGVFWRDVGGLGASLDVSGPLFLIALPPDLLIVSIIDSDRHVDGHSLGTTTKQSIHAP